MHVLKKWMVMYKCKLFVLKLNVERQEFLRETKLEHTHGTIMRIRLVVYNNFRPFSNVVVECPQYVLGYSKPHHKNNNCTQKESYIFLTRRWSSPLPTAN